MKKKKSSIDNIIGWIGVTTLMLAYLLLTTKAISSTNKIYQLLNLTGAVGLTYISYKQKAHQSTFINAIWIIISLYGIIVQ